MRRNLLTINVYLVKQRVCFRFVADENEIYQKKGF